MVSRSKAGQVKAKRGLAWQIFSHVRFVFVASVHDILVRISFKEIFLTGFVDHSCFRSGSREGPKVQFGSILGCFRR